MSKVFTCACGRRTTEPFLIGAEAYCTICAEQIDMRAVTQRERTEWQRYSREARAQVHLSARANRHDG